MIFELPLYGHREMEAAKAVPITGEWAQGWSRYSERAAHTGPLAGAKCMGGEAKTCCEKTAATVLFLTNLSPPINLFKMLL